MQTFKIQLPEKIIFNTMLEVRIYDINYGNHLGHDSLVSMFHEARVRFLRHLGYSELNIDGLGLLVTHLVVNYTGEAFLSDLISINMGITHITKTTIELMYQAVNSKSKKEIARGLTTMVFFDYQKRKVTRIPQKFLSKTSSLVSISTTNNLTRQV